MLSFQTHVALLLTKIQVVSSPNKNILSTVMCPWSCPLVHTALRTHRGTVTLHTLCASLLEITYVKALTKAKCKINVKQWQWHLW